MNFVQRRATTAKSKHSIENFFVLKDSFLDSVCTTVTMEEIPAELIMNWDQTGIKIVPSSSWTMEQRDSKMVKMTSVSYKQQTTAIFCGTMLGDFLPVQLMYKGNAPCCHPQFQFSFWVGYHPLSQTLVYWGDNDAVYQQKYHSICDEYLTITAWQKASTRNLQRSSYTLCQYSSWRPCVLATTQYYQSLDISVNKPAKDFLRGKFQEWHSEQVVKQLEGEDIE